MIQRVLWISQCVRSWDIWFFFLDKISLSTSCIVSANGLKFYRLIWNVFWLFYSILSICETIILTNSFIFTEERSSTGSSIMVRFQCFHWPQPLPYVCVFVVFTIKNISALQSYSILCICSLLKCIHSFKLNIMQVLPMPNVPFFWNLFRAYSHWRALQVHIFFGAYLTKAKPVW